MPRERPRTGSEARSASPTAASRSRTAAGASGSPYSRAAKSRFSAALRSSYRWLWWERSPISRRRAGSPASGAPSIVTRPALGRASPASSRSSVLFPAPLGPTTRWHSPGLTESETPRSARADPKRRSRSRASRRGQTAAGVWGRGEVTRGSVPARAGIYLRPPGLHVEQIGHVGEGQEEPELVARVLEDDPLPPGFRVPLDQHERGEAGGIDPQRRGEVDREGGPIRQAVQLADHPLAELHAGVQPQLFGGGDGAGGVGRCQGILSHARSDLETPPQGIPGGRRLTFGGWAVSRETSGS